MRVLKICILVFYHVKSFLQKGAVYFINYKINGFFLQNGFYKISPETVGQKIIKKVIFVFLLKENSQFHLRTENKSVQRQRTGYLQLRHFCSILRVLW